MTIAIGEQSFVTKRPKQLDQILIDATGCSSAELVAALSEASTGGHLAALVLPFLGKDAPDQVTLARLFAADLAVDRVATLAAVRAVLSEAEPPEVTPAPKAGGAA